MINLSVPKQAGVEDVWVTVQCPKLPSIIIGCTYRHPNTLSVVFEYIQDVLKTICMKNKAVYVLGDFNDNLFANNNEINNVIKNNKLTQLFRKATRVTPTSSTIVDLIVINKPDAVSSCDVVPKEIADHDLISIVVDISKPKRQPISSPW